MTSVLSKAWAGVCKVASVVWNFFTSSRLKSLYWRVGMMAVSKVVSYALANLASFNLPTEATVALGLVLGEVSKYLDTLRKDKVAAAQSIGQGVK